MSIEAGTSLGDICTILSGHHFNKIPVTKDGEMIGMVTRSDITRFIVSEYLGSLE